MSFKHSTFFFDYKSYKDELSSLSTELDKGNNSHLSLLVRNIREIVGDPEDWILNNKGTSIGNIGLDQKSEYRNGLIGHWLLIVLSKYLSPAKSLWYRWNRLSLLLRTIEWKEEDVKAVIFGNSIAALISTDYGVSTGTSIKWSDPYWMWIRPGRSIYSGWLPLESISPLKKRLTIVLKNLIDNDVSFPDQLSTQQFTRKEVEDLLITIISNYEIAENKNLGLYSIVYQED